MGQVLLYSAIMGFSLFAGSALVMFFNFPQRTIAKLMAFGAGALLCAMTYGLMEDAFLYGGLDMAILGFLIGGLTFIMADYLIHSAGSRRHKRKQYLFPDPKDYDKKISGRLIALGGMLDNFPEAMALGIALYNDQITGLMLLVAITLSNFPEGLSATAGMLREKISKGKILYLWFATAIMIIAVALLSYVFLRDINPDFIGFWHAFAAGAILAMLANTVMPEAYEEGDYTIGLVTVLGFLIAFVLARI